ncbi:hypothetical protein Ddc_07237 [Ditylenchus destructor]|nr:hypothetical protein Ddc_07237 [Ditylenchus destructor]
MQPATAASFDMLKSGTQVYPGMNSWGSIGSHSPQSQQQQNLAVSAAANYCLTDPAAAMYAGAYGRNPYDMMSYFSYTGGGQPSPHSPGAVYHQQQALQQQGGHMQQQAAQSQQQNGYTPKPPESPPNPALNAAAASIHNNLFRNTFGSMTDPNNAMNVAKDGSGSLTGVSTAAALHAMWNTTNPAMWTSDPMMQLTGGQSHLSQHNGM